jgi:prolyl oligopeptidase
MIAIRAGVVRFPVVKVTRSMAPLAAALVVLLVDVSIAGAGAAPAHSTSVAEYPVARTSDVIEEIAGEKVGDPYRWMEGNDNAERDAWLVAQGAYAATRLRDLPGREALLARIREVGLGTSRLTGWRRAGDRLFYMALPANAQLPRVEWRDVNDLAVAHVLVDPATLGGNGGHVGVDAMSPSPDGKHLAYNLSEGGAEITKIHVLDVESGKNQPDVVDRVWGEFAAAWLPDGSGFFYTQMAEVSGADPLQGMRVKLHRLGTSVADDPIVLAPDDGSPFHLQAQELSEVFVVRDTRWMVAVAGGARSSQRYALARLDDLDLTGTGRTPWRVIADYDDSLQDLNIHGDRLYVLSYKDAPARRVLSMPLERPDLAKATVEVAEDKEAPLSDFAVANDALYLSDLVNGHSRLRRLPWTAEGRATAQVVPLPFEGTIQQLVSDRTRDGVLVALHGWTRPLELFRWDSKRGALAPTGVAATATADTAGLVAEEVEVASFDGTPVPLSILRRDGLKLDGSHPTILTGYGGYGFALAPSFNPMTMVWLERGGVHAVCHVRGGGEKGEGWHFDGMGPRKMNGVRDFIACGEYLIRRGFTSASHLLATGGSMGGVLIGRALTERPELFAGAQIAVGCMNPLRILQAPNGANQLGELGSPETPEGAAALLAMDPYAHVKPDVAYPAILFTIGLNDNRVAPWMTCKMAARLQASSTSGRPILIRTQADAGHGVNSTRDQSFAERADVWSFLLAAAEEKPPSNSK